MSSYYERYQQGLYHEVYGELLILGERVFEEPIYEDALAVGRAMMRRVRSNLDQLIARLETMGYLFVDGFWDKENYGSLSSEEEAKLDQRYPIFAEPPAETPRLLNELEQRVGTLPITLKCWYEQIGSVNLIGGFPATKHHSELSDILDPLLIYSLGELKEYLSSDPSLEGTEDSKEKIELPLAPDYALKYGYSGSGPYSMELPCKAFDAPIEVYQSSQITFVNYLRKCIRWGGFFGLAEASSRPGKRRLTPDELDFLRKGLLPF